MYTMSSMNHSHTFCFLSLGNRWRGTPYILNCMTTLIFSRSTFCVDRFIDPSMIEPGTCRSGCLDFKHCVCDMERCSLAALKGVNFMHIRFMEDFSLVFQSINWSHKNVGLQKIRNNLHNECTLARVLVSRTLTQGGWPQVAQPSPNILIRT